MTGIGKPIRQIEAWPIELPIPKEVPQKEPKPEEVSEPQPVRAPA